MQTATCHFHLSSLQSRGTASKPCFSDGESATRATPTWFFRPHEPHRSHSNCPIMSLKPHRFEVGLHQKASARDHLGVDLTFQHFMQTSTDFNSQYPDFYNSRRVTDILGPEQ